MSVVRTGSRWVSPSGGGQIMVVRAPSVDIELACAGEPMAVMGTAAVKAPGAPPNSGQTIEIGKRYLHAGLGLEVLCVKRGAGPVTANGEPLAQQANKKLPSSD